jgi:hypothetical protein
MSRRSLRLLDASCHDDHREEEEQEYQTGLHHGANGAGKTMKVGMPVWLIGYRTNTFSLQRFQRHGEGSEKTGE